MSTLGDNIKALRESLGMTQEDLGKQVGVTGVTIMRYEKGQREPSLEQLEKLGEALHVQPSKLVGWNTGFLLSRLREERGLTQEDLAEKAQIPLETLQKYEQSSDIVPTADFVKILAAYGGHIEGTEVYEALCHAEKQLHEAMERNKAHEEELEDLRDSLRQDRLNAAFLLLNETGQEVAIQRLMELAQIPAYQCQYISAEERAELLKLCEE